VEEISRALPWLNPDIVEPERLLPLLKQYPADKMEEWQVGDEARNPKNDYPELLRFIKVSLHKSPGILAPEG
jgi:hypothetical protein